MGWEREQEGAGRGGRSHGQYPCRETLAAALKGPTGTWAQDGKSWECVGESWASLDKTSRSEWVRANTEGRHCALDVCFFYVCDIKFILK